MKKYIYIFMAAAAVATLASCEKENTFQFNEGKGMVDCNTLTIGYNTSTRANEEMINNFMVYFINNATNEVEASYRYGQLPSLVSLPVGSYRIEADHGENPVADWESPYYFGKTQEFSVSANTITKIEQNVSCSLSNIRIKVNIDQLCAQNVQNAKVTVKVGDEGSLEYDATTNGKAGYFKYVVGSSSIVAELTGTLNGEAISQIVEFNDAAGGKSYTVNFTANSPDNENPGEIGSGADGVITIDSSITVDSHEFEVDVDDPNDEILDDDMRN